MAGSRRLGSDFEDEAAELLIEKGFTIVTRRFKAKKGELDLVALEGDQLVFVEVKQRKAGYIPEESISRQKIERLYSAAREYLVKTDQPEREFRFDVVAIGFNETRHHRDVFRDHVDLGQPEEFDDDPSEDC
ncbi:MAG: YraN family protein [Chlorobia bacterium]|nr:YraN family protein [Fimbriimonadaceae bacterium]